MRGGGSPALPGGRSAAGEPAGRFPGCGCWDQLLSSAAAAGSPLGGGYHGDQRPCVKLCDHAPVARERKRSITQTVCVSSVSLYKHMRVYKINI